MKFALLCLCIIAVGVIAHEHPFGMHQTPCEHDHIMEKFLTEHPGMREEMLEMRERVKQTAEEFLENRLRHGAKETLELVRIPVVWHVLQHSSAPETLDVTAEGINNEMAWINEWFSATNTYYNTGSSYWANQIATASDFQIEFVLASTDPNGAATTGINFYTTTVANTCADGQIQDSAQGGVDAWNTRPHLNVGVCKINTGAAGYAYLPSPNGYTHPKDGMVLRSQYVGDDYITGSIFAHEMGHWLGLPHTFGSSCAHTDNVPDTPTSDSNGFNYVSGNAACPGNGGMTDEDFIRCNNVIMIQNCMDYNYEHCKAFFSKGQTAVMRAFLDDPASVRGLLKTSPGLGSACTPNCNGRNCGTDGCGGSCGSCGSGESCSNNGVCQCVPNCAGKACGSDGCGGSCGSCSSGLACNNANQCVCSPNCNGKNCGDDGCGGSCGSCSGQNVCSNTGVCECSPNCNGKNCGTDGCGGSCGSCTSGNSCSNNGVCECVPNCTGKECGSDGCGGSCGSCGGNEACSSGTCVSTCTPSCAGKDCGDDGCGGSCGSCGSGESCSNSGVCECVPDCLSKDCGADGCGGSCGTCPNDQTCNANNQCQCVPNCTGKECGSDGCGGSCGSCGAGDTCISNTCQCEANCAGKQCGSDGCGGSCGSCPNGQTCGASDTCECTPDCTGKQCGSDGCGGSCGSCSGSESCSANGQCQCAPNCPAGVDCGSDGCGGSCGSCGAGESCSNGSCQCIPNCNGQACGPDGCGGSCGSCSAGETCNANNNCVGSTSLDGFRDQILSDHNNLRSDVIPSPETSLTPLGYSLSLEADAQAWADTCTYGHSGNGNGENIYYRTGDATGDLVALASNADNSWESEKAYYTLTANGGSCASGQVCGHYTHMIWDHANYPTTEVGYGGLWTMVVCNYAGPGNYVGLKPYEPCTSNSCDQSGGCTSTCPEGACGEYVTECGEVLDCGPCCDDPCAQHECGSHQNSCNTSINCGNCPSGQSCTATSNGNQCQADAPCEHAAECAAGGFTCGNKLFCGVNQVCGHCAVGEECVDFVCVANPCGSCGANTECVNDSCECLAGYVMSSNGNCIVPTLITDFVQTLPAGDPSFTIPDTVLQLNGQGPHILKWESTGSVVDLYTTRASVTVQVDSGEFGFSIRHGQNTGNRANDRIMWHVRDIGSNPALAICLVYYSNSYCSGYNSISFPTTPTEVHITMGFDGANILTSWQVETGSIWSSSISQSYYPQLGAISYFLSPTGGDIPSLSETSVVTSSTLTVALSGCIDDSEWEQMFFAMTGADPATTSVQVRGVGENGNCGKSASGKVLVSGFTTVISSSSVPAAALSSALVNSVGGPAAANFGVASASIVGGAAGASAAGFPVSVAALPGTAIAAPGSAAAAGAGAGAAAGGAAGGLSGGAIAGIVVGSVGGAVLLVGVTTLVVAAVIVGAVVLSKSDDDSSPQDNGDRRKSVRQTLRGFFGGVDVMNDPGKGHQSITGRSPAI